jgi:tetratricopeptide (TPR) repeat protein
MGRFIASVISLTVLTLSFPLIAQVTAADSSPQQRIPPPPENATAEQLEQQGDMLRAQKAFMDSVDYYRAAIKKADSATLHNKTGISLFTLLRDSEARKEYQRAIKLDKNYPEPHNNLGALYYRATKYGAAMSEYKKAIKLNDLNATFHSNLGSAYYSIQDYDGAIREYTRAVQLDPYIFDHQGSGGSSIRLVTAGERGHLHYLMAQMYCQNGNLERCRFYLSKANEEGYSIKDALRDDQFAAMRKDPAFVEFVRSLKPPGSNE